MATSLEARARPYQGYVRSGEAILVSAMTVSGTSCDVGCPAGNPGDLATANLVWIVRLIDADCRA